MSKVNFNVSGFNLINKLNNVKKAEQNQPQHNPFAVNFTSRELKADIFEKMNATKQDNKINPIEKVAKHISAIQDKFSNGFKSAVSFAGEVKNQAKDAWKRLNSIEVKSACDGIIEHYSIPREVRILMGKPVKELAGMMKDEITA